MFWTSLTLLAMALTPEPSGAFYNVEVGDKVENVQLRTLDGKTAPLLKKSAEANLFLFFRPDQEATPKVLTELGECARSLANRPVYIVAVVSDSHPRDQVREIVDSADLHVPVLIDVGNALYGKLGVSLTPVVGLTDKNWKLTAYLPFRQVDYAHLVRAHVEYQLGNLTKAELERAISPEKVTDGGNEALAKRDLHLAELLYASKKYDKAEEFARKSTATDPDLAAAHGLLARILAAKGDCKAAGRSIESALRLDPNDTRGLEARAACGGGG